MAKCQINATMTSPPKGVGDIVIKDNNVAIIQQMYHSTFVGLVLESPCSNHLESTRSIMQAGIIFLGL